MRNIGFVLGRELGAYFATPLAYIFIVIFLVLAGTLVSSVGLEPVLLLLAAMSLVAAVLERPWKRC